MAVETVATPSKPQATVRLRPDQSLVRNLLDSGGESLRQCMQCATCSAACAITNTEHPLPRKEMLWAQWGLRARLMADIDLWLCHECRDCSKRCPRNARPSDVMAALRRECISYYSSPNALGRWANHPFGLIIFGGISSCIFSLSLAIWRTTGGSRLTASTFGTRFALSFWSEIPRDLVVLLFSSVVIFDLMVLLTGIQRFWKALKIEYSKTAPLNSSASWKTTFSTTVFRITSHHDFKRCANEIPKHANHTLVMCGMLGLVAADLWIIFAPFNPLLHGLVYPLGPSEPWKFVANIAGLTLLIGICDMMRQRVQRNPTTLQSISERHTSSTSGANERKTNQEFSQSDREIETTGTYSDWLLLIGVAATVITGFATELLHFARLDTLRWSFYVIHLFVVLTLLLVLPYSKLAHVAYRTAAFAFVERYGIRRNTTMNSPEKVIEQ